MPVNFQALAPLQVQASPMQALPSAPQQPSALQQLGQGLTGAVQAYQNAELNDTNIALNKQRLQAGEMDLQERTQKFQDGQSIRAAAAQGREQYLKALSTYDPPAAMEYLKKEKEVEKLSAETFQAKSQGEKIKSESHDAIMSQIGSVVNTAETWRDPNTGEPMDPQRKAAYIMGGLELIGPSAVEFVTKISPNGYDQTTALVLQQMGMQADANIMDKNNKGQTPSDTSKRIREINQSRKAQGLPPLSAAETEQIQQKALDKTIAPAQSLTQNPYDVQGAEADKQIAVTANEARSKMISFRDFNSEALKQLPKVPGYALGPISSAIKLDQLSPEAQQLKGYLAASTLLAKDILGLKGGTQGFTEGERKFVEQVAGGTFQNKVTLKELMTTMNRLSYKVEHREWEKEKNFRSNMSPEKYQKWLEENPEPKRLYTRNGLPFDMDAAKKQTGLSEEEIAKQAGLE